jgi:predicted nucleotide-binding protein
MSNPISTLLDYIEEATRELGAGIRKKSYKKIEAELQKIKPFSDCLKSHIPDETSKTVFENFDRHLHFIERYLNERNMEMIKHNFEDLRDRDLPSVRSKVTDISKNQKSSEKRRILSKDIFIIHGRDHRPMKELKTMLSEFSLNPVVLHEKPGGSMTIIEKLERYSQDIGFAFVVSTPDDALFPAVKSPDKRYIPSVQPPIFRTRQNVILEFGYFIAKLGRLRVCCLYKGATELPYDMPSDMHGIVYIPFKESVDEARDMIMKELKAAGYELVSKQPEKEKEDMEGNKSLRKEVEELKDRLDRRVD